MRACKGLGNPCGIIHGPDSWAGKTMDEKRSETKKIFCNTCKRVTNHVLKARFSLQEEMTEDKYESDFTRYQKEWNSEVEGIHVHRYSLWSCAGCTVPTAEWEIGTENTNSPDSFECMSDSRFFPPREKGSIHAKTYTKLNQDMTNLYREVVACFNGDCLVLCTIGLRSLLEAICGDKGVGGDKENLEQKIDGLIKFLPSLNIIEALHGVRLTGNRAVHRLEPLSKDDAAAAIDVIEDLLNFLYDLDYKASKIRNPMKLPSSLENKRSIQ